MSRSPDRPATQRPRRVRTRRQIVEGRAQALRWGVWTSAIFGTVAVLLVLLAVIRDRAFHVRHGVGFLLGGLLLAAAWLQHRWSRNRSAATRGVT